MNRYYYWFPKDKIQDAQAALALAGLSNNVQPHMVAGENIGVLISTGWAMKQNARDLLEVYGTIKG